jgi:hypothetical protein
MTCEWVWSWQEAGSFGDFVGGLGAAAAFGWALCEFRRRNQDLRREQAKLVLIRLMGRPAPRPGALRADNHSAYYVDRVAWYLPFRPRENGLSEYTT